MRYSASTVATGLASALSLIATAAHSEIWDKELTKGDFIAFDMACRDDEGVVNSLIEEVDADVALQNRELAVVGRISASYFDGTCYEFRGACLIGEQRDATVPLTVFYDEQKLPLWHCAWPVAERREWKVVKTVGTAYELGLNLRLH